MPPVPDEEIVSQDGSLLIAVQAHPPGAATPTEPAPPEAGTAPVEESSEYEHAVADCEIGTVWPPIVNVVERGAAEALAATFTKTVPSPAPVSGKIEAHESALDAVHEQLGPFVVTPIVPAPPADPKGLPRPDVSTVTLHARPACVMRNDCPPMASVPEREVVVEFGSTEYTSVPDSVPEPPDMTEIQLGPSTVA